MNKITLKIIGLLILLFNTHLFAAEKYGLYAGLQTSQVSVNDLTSSDILVHVGKYITPDISTELRVGVGINNTKNKAKDTYKTNLLLGAYLMKHINIDIEGFSRLYGILGYTLLNYGYTKNNEGNFATANSTSAGVGIDFHLKKNSYMRVEYFDYNPHIEHLDSKVTAITLGFTTKF